MPLFPRVASSLSGIPGAVYSALVHRLAAHQGEVYPFHVGDTWMEPAVGCRMEDLTVAEYPGMHRYAPVQGHPELLDAICERQGKRLGIEVQRAEVLVTAGATGGLGAVVGGLVDDGDEVLILAPYWPLIAGIVRSFHGLPVPVPFFDRVATADEAVSAVEAHLTDRTVALYLNTPHNPTSRVIPADWLGALAQWAAARGLWILADEVYEDYCYRGRHHYTRPLAPERTFSVHSFSKAWGMAGNRAGYVIGPAPVMSQIRKVSVHTFYSTPTAAQLAGIRAFRGGADAWVDRARALYQEVGRRAARILGVPEPEGGTFLFLDVAPALGDDGLPGFLERCVERGLLVAPGPSFGPYPTSIRVCFTATPPEVTERGMRVLADLLGR